MLISDSYVLFSFVCICSLSNFNIFFFLEKRRHIAQSCFTAGLILSIISTFHFAFLLFSDRSRPLVAIPTLRSLYFYLLIPYYTASDILILIPTISTLCMRTFLPFPSTSLLFSNFNHFLNSAFLLGIRARLR